MLLIVTKNICYETNSHHTQAQIHFCIPGTVLFTNPIVGAGYLQLTHTNHYNNNDYNVVYSTLDLGGGWRNTADNSNCADAGIQFQYH
jgi:hypothetical protein